MAGAMRSWPRPPGVKPELEWTDLHNYLADPNETSEPAVLAAIARFPEQVRTQHAGFFLPVHFAAAFYGTKAICELLHESYPEGTRARSKIGQVPLHLASHNGQLEAVRVFWSVYPDAVHLEDGWGMTPVDLAWRKGHWHVVDFLESRSGVGPKKVTSSGEVIAPYDPTTPLEAEIFAAKYKKVFAEADPASSSENAPNVVEDASGLPMPGEPDFPHQAEYEAQQERWKQALANVPERIAVETWIGRHPESFLAQKLERNPALREEWREQIRLHIEWMWAQGNDPDEALRQVREAAREREERKAKQREELMALAPDEEEET